MQSNADLYVVKHLPNSHLQVADCSRCPAPSEVVTIQTNSTTQQADVPVLALRCVLSTPEGTRWVLRVWLCSLNSHAYALLSHSRLRPLVHLDLAHQVDRYTFRVRVVFGLQGSCRFLPQDRCFSTCQVPAMQDTGLVDSTAVPSCIQYCFLQAAITSW
jgi:hypothetical protein